MAQASHYCHEYKHFTGSGHVIPDNYDTYPNNSPSIYQPLPHDKLRESNILSHEPPLQMREPPYKMREMEPTSNPHTDSDFALIEKSLLLSPFC